MNPIERAQAQLRKSLVHCVKCGFEHPRDGRCILPVGKRPPVTLTDVLVYEAEQSGELEAKPKTKRAANKRGQKASTEAVDGASTPSSVKAKGRVAAHPTMNEWERRRAGELEALRQRGEILFWRFEGATLRLANGARYTPDFLVMDKDGGLRAEEVKGHFREAAKVRIKVAASIFPFPFIVLSEPKNGEWKRWEVPSE